MANWASTSFWIKTSKKDEILSAFKALEKENEYTWFFELLNSIGESKERYCRGYVTFFSESDGRFDSSVYVETESAWEPMPDVIEDFVRHFDDRAEVLYAGDEFGEDIHWTNIGEFVGDGEDDWRYEMTEISEIRRLNRR